MIKKLLYYTVYIIYTPYLASDKNTIHARYCPNMVMLEICFKALEDRKKEKSKNMCNFL